ncbi:UNKNOWN [Stylonychia lemnae]|uniref:Srp40 C-terminal domain-containing protein n=1 Tax=Stylonychia lemnae TaxID=5949 RepID=A0A077ZRT5_STYLE|nr:UNKNOWN [Stylonychia lemnae]|eukprot:CDW72628.1 UNKNOWN [Stylonychia lemnae]
MKIGAEDLWPLILDFIQTFFGAEDLKHFKEYFKLKIKHEVQFNCLLYIFQNDPIVKAGGIQVLLGNYLKHNKEIYKQYKKHLKNKKKAESSDEESGESSDDEDSKKKQKNGKLVGKKRTKNDDSSDNDDSDKDGSESEGEKKQKNGKTANKRARKSSSVSRGRSKSIDSNGPITRKKSMDMGEYVPPIKDPKSQALQTNFKFQRINEEKFKSMDEVAADNTFESKARFGQGGGDAFGLWSNDKLKDKVGKGFKKEKGKMKNRNFHSQGQRIGYGVNSVKF